MKNTYFAFALCVLLCGCGTFDHVSEFYVPAFSGNTGNFFEPYSGQTRLEAATQDMQETTLRLMEKRYALIGSSNFKACDPVTQEMMLQQGRLVQADIVIYDIKDAGVTQALMPMPRYEPGETYNTVITGPGMSSAMATTTTPGTFTTDYVPYSEHWYNYQICFYRRHQPRISGILVGPLTDELKSKLDRNAGVLVLGVEEDSPAFAANIVVGDVITAINDKPVKNKDQYGACMLAMAGSDVTITLLHEGKEKKIPLRLNPNFALPPPPAVLPPPAGVSTTPSSLDKPASAPEGPPAPKAKTL